MFFFLVYELLHKMIFISYILLDRQKKTHQVFFRNYAYLLAKHELVKTDYWDVSQYNWEDNDDNKVFCMHKNI